MLISGKCVYPYHIICTWRGDKQRMSLTIPYIYTEIVPLDHDSGEKRECQSFFQIYSTLVVFTSVTHSSPTLTARASRSSYLNGHHFTRFQFLKNPALNQATSQVVRECVETSLACASTDLVLESN